MRRNIVRNNKQKLFISLLLIFLAQKVISYSEPSFDDTNSWESTFSGANKPLRYLYYNGQHYGAYEGGIISVEESHSSNVQTKTFTDGDGYLGFLPELDLIYTSDLQNLWLCNPKDITKCTQSIDISLQTGNTRGNIQIFKAYTKSFIYVFSRAQKRAAQYDYLTNTRIDTNLAVQQSLVSYDENSNIFVVVAPGGSIFYDIDKTQNTLSIVNLALGSAIRDISPDLENFQPGIHLVLLNNCRIFLYSTVLKNIYKELGGSFDLCSIDITDDSDEIALYKIEVIRGTRYALMAFNDFMYFLNLDFIQIENHIYDKTLTTTPTYPVKDFFADVANSRILFLTPNGETKSFPISSSLCFFSSKTCEEALKPDKCTDCKDGYLLREGYCIRGDCLHLEIGYGYRSDLCQDTCPTASYLRQDIGICSSCQKNCLECQNSEICTKCISGYFVDFETKSCVTQCPQGFTEKEDNATCQPCYPACKECDGVGMDQCESCPDDRELENNQCLLEIGNRECNDLIEYFDEEENRCLPCDSSCKGCTGPTDKDCKACSSDSLLLNLGSCVESCPSGTYKQAT